MYKIKRRKKVALPALPTIRDEGMATKLMIPNELRRTPSNS
jgi:hypothetical protein